jgi:hypothetical protein
MSCVLNFPVEIVLILTNGLCCTDRAMKHPSSHPFEVRTLQIWSLVSETLVSENKNRIRDNVQKSVAVLIYHRHKVLAFIELGDNKIKMKFHTFKP